MDTRPVEVGIIALLDGGLILVRGEGASPVTTGVVGMVGCGCASTSTLIIYLPLSTIMGGLVLLFQQAAKQAFP